MREVTKVTEIEIEVWTCIDLVTVLNKIGHGGSRCAKMAIARRREWSRLWKSSC